MSDEATLQNPEFKAAFLANEQQERLNTGKVASALVFALMPAGIVLDRAMYPDEVGEFLMLRLLCSLLAGILFYLHTTEFGRRHYKWLGLPIALLPAGCIAVMIHLRQGPVSPYYAGLNLILLAVSVVVHWSTAESLAAVGGVLLMYSAACLARGTREQWGIIFNNYYFLVLTGIIVVTGNHFFNRLRFREFALRYELDRNRKALEETNQKLLELDQIKGRFFANISHELRTPLTLLLSPLETMLHGQRAKFDADTRSLMTIMHGNGMRLLKLINDLLDLVRLESGRMEVKREPLEMSAFLRGLMGAAQQMAEAKGLKLETWVEPGLGALMLDKDKLEKMILNLVFNALKFTPAGGTVGLRVEQAGGQLVIAVKDTGVGIAEKNLPFVFDRFWQADDSSKRKYQGVGIGLSLVKEFTELQGGVASVESQVGKGTTFTLRLPLVKAETAPKPEVTPAVVQPASPEKPATAAPAQSEEWLANLYHRAALMPSTAQPEAVSDSAEAAEAVPAEAAQNGTNGTNGTNGSHPNLLVADDEPDMLRFLKSQLRTHYKVIEAVDGQQAVDKAGQLLPDIILLDMNMPEKDGLQACRELRALAATQEIPIIILTARADEETKLAALSAGANDFLTKPFSTSELHVRVKNLVESHHYKEKLADKNRQLETAIEKLKESESLLVQTEKMMSLGRMSAGIIHEINNPLNYATTGLFTLRNKGKQLAPEHRAEYEEILRDVEDGIKRVKSIVTDLKTFTHPDTEQMDLVDVAAIVNSALRFLSNEWKDKVVIEQKLPEKQVIHGNRNKLLQVMVILLQNSLDAMKEKTFANGERPTIRIEGSVAGGKSTLIVRDNGIGIKAADLGKIYDPFFTTKDVGEGMGLGLTICYRIVQEYEGQISVKSEPEKFSEFKLEFPAKG